MASNRAAGGPGRPQPITTLWATVSSIGTLRDHEHYKRICPATRSRKDRTSDADFRNDFRPYRTAFRNAIEEKRIDDAWTIPSDIAGDLPQEEEGRDGETTRATPVVLRKTPELSNAAQKKRLHVYEKTLAPVATRCPLAQAPAR